jgi:hypothetical protein
VTLRTPESATAGFSAESIGTAVTSDPPSSALAVDTPLYGSAKPISTIEDAPNLTENHLVVHIDR